MTGWIWRWRARWRLKHRPDDHCTDCGSWLPTTGNGCAYHTYKAPGATLCSFCVQQEKEFPQHAPPETFWWGMQYIRM